MDVLELDPGMAQDFVKLLNTKLKETKAELDAAAVVRSSIGDFLWGMLIVFYRRTRSYGRIFASTKLVAST